MSVHEYDNEIIEEYENRDSNDERDSHNEAEEDNSNENDQGTKGRRVDPTDKKKVRNPIPKLNTERLKGPKGIHIIENYFDGFKFHGKGHEKQDLDRVMKRLEHWSHRLFPKTDFDEFLEKLERLGTKKDLQVYIKKYRLDMLTPDDGIILADDENDEENNMDNAPIDEFDILIAEQIEKQKQATRSHNNSAFDDLLNDSTNGNPYKESDVSHITSVSIEKQPEVNVKKIEMTDEIKERIERNRQQAIQRRLARLKALEEEAKKKKVENSEIEGKNDADDVILEDDKNDDFVKSIDGIEKDIDESQKVTPNKISEEASDA